VVLILQAGAGQEPPARFLRFLRFSVSKIGPKKRLEKIFVRKNRKNRKNRRLAPGGSARRLKLEASRAERPALFLLGQAAL
jgi:hypothetical protein